jgi:SNF2 family DNA or RNA helicase
LTECSYHTLVLDYYDFPFALHPYQVEAVNYLAPLPRTGLYLQPGLGKTVVATFCALYQRIMGKSEVTLGIMPPLLVTQWARWLSNVKPKNGRPLRVALYQGSPAERRAVSFDADFVLMGIQIFKRDIERVTYEFSDKDVFTFLDEAQCIKDVGSQNYQRFRDFVEDRRCQLLTGTPLNVPMDGYAFINLVAPGIYRNLLDFTNTHVLAVDQFDAPRAYKNLDVLEENLLVNSFLRTKEDVLLDLPEAIITEIEYDLDKKHYALYRTLANDKLILLPDGEKIDATQATALYHALGQIVCQWHHFGADPTLKSKIYSLIEEILDELGDKKLIVFSNYQRTNEEIVRRFGCPGIWGQIPHAQKLVNQARFLDDDKCRLIAMHPQSGGVGLDGFQHVCQDVLYAEPPITPSHWTQSLSRVHREGQKQAVTVRMAIARGTLQRHLTTRLSEKEALIQPIQGAKAYLTPADIRRIVFGGE